MWGDILKSGDNKKITVNATLDNLPEVTDLVEEMLKKSGCPGRIASKIMVCVEELFVNITNYAYNPSVGECTVDMETKTLSNGGAIKLVMRDSGTPFNPFEREEPDITLSADERSIGGLGIFMVKKIMDSVQYEYTNNENIVTLEKSWQYEQEI